MTPMNRSRLGLGAMGDPTEQYANDPYPSMQSSMMPTNPFSPFSMSSMLPLNKFSGSGMGNLLGGYGMMNPWVQNPWANYQPTQWAGPNAYYPNWNDPAGPFANDVAMMGPLPVPTDPSLPPPVEVEGADEELQAARIARSKQVSENFYRNNPDHPLSRFDAALRKALGVPQLGTAYNMGQGITPQTNWAGQGVTPQPEPDPQTQPQYQTDPGLAGSAAYRHGSFPVLGPQRTGMEYQYMGALKPRTATTTRPTWQESHAFEEAARKRGEAAKRQAAIARKEQDKRAAAQKAASRKAANQKAAGMAKAWRTGSIIDREGPSGGYGGTGRGGRGYGGGYHGR